MRWILVLSALVLAGVGGAALARGADDAEADVPAKELKELQATVALLEMQVDYLLQREAALTPYVAGNLGRGARLQRGLAASRREGFTKAAISSTSRELLLRTLEEDAQAILRDVPARTKDQEQLLKQIERRMRAR